MAIESVKDRLSALSNVKDEAQLRFALGAIVDAIQALATKLDNDATVTDVNYGAVVAAIVTD